MKGDAVTQPQRLMLARLKASAQRNPRAAVLLASGVLVIIGVLPVVAQIFHPQPRWLSVIAVVGITLVEISFLTWTGLDAKKEHTWLAVVFGIAGACLFTLWVTKVLPLQGLGLLGAILVYAAIGHLLLVWRRASRWPPLRGLSWLAFCLVAFLVAWELLTPSKPRNSSTASVLGFSLLALSVLTVPVGLSLLSEDVLQRLRRLRPSTERRWIVTLAAIGALLVVITLLALLQVSSGADILTARPMVVVSLAALFLLGAIVANTRLDSIVVICGLVALLVVAPGVAPSPTAVGDGPVLVALGDSYMSGEGAEKFFEGTDVAGKNECRRAPSAYAELFASDNGGFPGGFVSFACSGARAAHMVNVVQYPNEPVNPDGSAAGLTQLQQLGMLLDSGADVSLVLLSIGGNDSGFSTIGMTCVAPGQCGSQESLWLDNLGQVRLALRTTYAQLNATMAAHGAEDVPVVVVPYPDPLNDYACGAVTLEQREVDFLHRFIKRLNRVVRTEGEHAGFTYLGPMVGSLARVNLRLCDRGEEVGVNFVSPQSVNGAVEQWANPSKWVHSSFHPDEDGHGAMAATLSEWWTARGSDLVPGDEEEVTQEAADDEENLDVAPQCSMVEVGNAEQDRAQLCTGLAQLWALGETRAMLIPWGALALVTGFGGAWLLWLALIAGWRRR